jgi:hypothetical protein
MAVRAEALTYQSCPDTKRKSALTCLSTSLSKIDIHFVEFLGCAWKVFW